MKSACVAVLIALPVFCQEPSGKGVNFYSIEREIRIGQQIGADLERTIPIVHVPKLDAYVSKLGAALAGHADGRFPYHFVIYEDRGFPAAPLVVLGMPQDPFLGQPVEPVAVCGGPVFVPISLLANAESEAEFAFQLAHAIAHVSLRQATREATREEVVNLAMIPVGAARVPNVAAHVEWGIELGFVASIRSFERQADIVATSILSEAGYDPEAMIRVLERQAALGIGATGKVFATHPAPERRIETIATRLTDLPLRGYVTTSTQFAQMKALASSLF